MKKFLLLILTMISCIVVLSEVRYPEMVKVEKGTFMMGDNFGDGFEWEKPVHKVTFTYTFYIGKYEITFDEYDSYCEDTGKKQPSDSVWGRGIRPVINVSWFDAIEYCNWLSKKEGVARAYDSKGNLLDKSGKITTDVSRVEGYRLGTEAEWEYAARGGVKSKGFKYAGSKDINETAIYFNNYGKDNNRTQETGSKKSNELGIYDMLGNVWEWCGDWYDINFYQKSPETNPYNGVTGTNRIIRGGSWGFVSNFIRMTGRSGEMPDTRNSIIGFRIFKTAK